MAELTNFSNAPQDRFTGRTLVTFAPGFEDRAHEFSVFSISGAGLEDESPTYFPTLGIAVVPGDTMFSQSTREQIIATEPERWMYAIGTVPQPVPSNMIAVAAATWGLDVIGAAQSAASGAGITVAVLDTGMDTAHQDFSGRQIVSKSFVPGEAVDDGNGHGTHCIGTACGPLRPATQPRYGVAYESRIAAGKVLANSGRGKGAWILAGIEWALEIGARVISLSLGSAVEPGESHSPAYEAAAVSAMQRGTIIVAAAGNDSRRPHTVRPVGSPANCPSVLAVASVGRSLRVSEFSCAHENGNGGELNVSGPGESVLSAAPGSGYAMMTGTSMATPHVAGIAAQRLQVTPTLTAQQLWRELERTCRALADGPSDVGHGLAQCP